MKKILLMLMVGVLFIISPTSTQAQSGNLINGDFSNGIPDGWEVSNSSGSEQFDGFTRVYNDSSADPTELLYEASLPDGVYKLSFEELYASEQFDSNDLNIQILAEDMSIIHNFDYDYERGEADYILDIDEDDAAGENPFGYIKIQFDGGYRSSPTEYDYLDIGDISLERYSDVSYMDTVTLNGDMDADIATVDDPTQFTTENLSNASVFLQDQNNAYREVVDKGSATTDWTYTEESTSYDAVQSSDEEINLHFDEYYDTSQGDVTVQNFADYPVEVTVLMHDAETIEDEYAYPLEDYYYYEWTVTEDESAYEEYIAPTYGPTSFFEDDRLDYAHIFVEDVKVLEDGYPTENTVNDAGQVFDEYNKVTRIYELVQSDWDGLGTPALSFVHTEWVSGDDNPKVGDLRVIAYDFDSGQTEVTVTMYLPKETEDVNRPLPGEDEEIPGGTDGSDENIRGVLAVFNMDNTPGYIVFASLTLLLANVLLALTKISGMAYPVVNIGILGLLYFGGFIPIWVMLTLSFVIALMMIGLRGGMQRYD